MHPPLPSEAPAHPDQERDGLVLSTDPRGMDVDRVLDAIDAHRDLQGLRRWSLLTRDAHALYAANGWTPVKSPLWYMERTAPKIYLRLGTSEPTDG